MYWVNTPELPRICFVEEMHTLIKFMVSVVASNTVDGFFNPLIDLNTLEAVYASARFYVTC